MALGLGTHASGTRLAVFLDKGAHVRPEVFLPDGGEGFVLSEVSREDVVMFVLQELESEVVFVRYVDPVVPTE